MYVCLSHMVCIVSLSCRYERQSDRLQIYAPYSCRYVIYNAEEVSVWIRHVLYMDEIICVHLLCVLCVCVLCVHYHDRWSLLPYFEKDRLNVCCDRICRL